MSSPFFKYRKLLIALALICLFVFVSTHAFADELPLKGSGVLDSTFKRFMDAISVWGGSITAAAQWLFWALALISFVWTFGIMALQKSDAGDIFVELCKYIMFTGFFWWLLKNGSTFSLDIFNSLTKLAGSTGGVSKDVSPSSIIDIGFDMLSAVVNSPLNLGNLIIALMVAVIVVCILAIISIELMVLYISAYFLAYAGVILLGFGGNRWTNEIAINYYRKALALGIELFALILIVGLGNTILGGYYADANATKINVDSSVTMLVAAIALLLISQKVPALLASIVPGGGGGTGGFGALSATAAMAIGAAAGAAGGAAKMGGGAAKMAGGAAVQAAGVGKAIFSASNGPNASAKSVFAKMAKAAGQEAKSMAGGAASKAGAFVNNKVNSSFGGRMAARVVDNNFVGPRQPQSPQNEIKGGK